jgi:hypothetical protein
VNIDELLDDLEERLDRGITELESMACDMDARRIGSLNETLRLRSKATGLHIVKDWLRSYRPPLHQNGENQ